MSNCVGKRTKLHRQKKNEFQLKYSRVEKGYSPKENDGIIPNLQVMFSQKTSGSLRLFSAQPAVTLPANFTLFSYKLKKAALCRHTD